MRENKTYTVGELSKLIKKSVNTLQRWDRDKILIAHRTPTGRRYYTHEQYLQYCGLEINNSTKVNVTYSRVSSHGQKQDLKNQISAIEQYCIQSGTVIDFNYKEIGSALNYKRPIFNQILKDVEMNLINKIIIAHKDRLVRFGFEWFKNFIESHGTELVIINQEVLSPQEEVVNDLMTIINCFSSRLYGLRNYKSKNIIKDLVSLNESGISNDS